MHLPSYEIDGAHTAFIPCIVALKQGRVVLACAMSAAKAPRYLSLKVFFGSSLVFSVEHCLKQTFRGRLRRKMWTILPRALSGVWEKNKQKKVFKQFQAPILA